MTDEQLRAAYWYLMHNPTGYQEDLSKIHIDLPEKLMMAGVIEYDVNCEGALRYHVTEFGAEYVRVGYDTIAAKLIRDALEKIGI